MKPSRKDYMEGRCTHREYYGSLVEELGIRFTKEKDIERFRRSIDLHFNDIPLRWWDALASRRPAGSTAAFKARGDFVTTAGLVCLYKEAARRAIE